MLDAFADSEICDFDLSFRINKDIFRLDVPVDGVSDVMNIIESKEDLEVESGILFPW